MVIYPPNCVAISNLSVIVPAATPLPALGPSIARLTQSLSTLTMSHASNTSALTNLAEERLQLEERDKEMREMVTKAEAKRSWFAAMKEWIESIAVFLDEKVRVQSHHFHDDIDS